MLLIRKKEIFTLLLFVSFEHSLSFGIFRRRFYPLIRPRIPFRNRDFSKLPPWHKPLPKRNLTEPFGFRPSVQLPSGNLDVFNPTLIPTSESNKDVLRSEFQENSAIPVTENLPSEYGFDTQQPYEELPPADYSDHHEPEENYFEDYSDLYGTKKALREQNESNEDDEYTKFGAGFHNDDNVNSHGESFRSETEDYTSNTRSQNNYEEEPEETSSFFSTFGDQFGLPPTSQVSFSTFGTEGASGKDLFGDFFPGGKELLDFKKMPKKYRYEELEQNAEFRSPAEKPIESGRGSWNDAHEVSSR